MSYSDVMNALRAKLGQIYKLAWQIATDQLDGSQMRRGDMVEMGRRIADLCVAEEAGPMPYSIRWKVTERRCGSDWSITGQKGEEVVYGYQGGESRSWTKENAALRQLVRDANAGYEGSK